MEVSNENSNWKIDHNGNLTNSRSSDGRRRWKNGCSNSAYARQERAYDGGHARMYKVREVDARLSTGDDEAAQKRHGAGHMSNDAESRRT